MPMFVWKKTHNKLKEEYVKLAEELKKCLDREEEFLSIIKKYEELQKIHHIEKEEMIKEMINIKKENDELKKMIYPEVARR